MESKSTAPEFEYWRALKERELIQAQITKVQHVAEGLQRKYNAVNNEIETYEQEQKSLND